MALVQRLRGLSALAAEAAPATSKLWTVRNGEESPSVSDAHRVMGLPFDPPSRLLMGPGPANAHPRVLAAQTFPLLGHMHPPYFKLMDEVQEGLRYVFQTDTKYTLCMSGTGHAGMEATIANLVEPGETVLVGNKGIWGMRVADLAARYGAKVEQLETGGAPRSFSLEEITRAVETHKPALLFLCQGESSMGVHQSFAGIGEVCRANGTLFLADTVCSLGGVPFFADAWGVDAMYSGSQKALAAPPGAGVVFPQPGSMAPLMLNDRAMEKLANRKTKVASYQNDLTLIGDYWGWYDKRFYHHTGMVSMTYAMREALELVKGEGLDAMWQRHTDMHHMLWDGLAEIGLEPYVPAEQDRLVTVNTIKVPEGVDALKVIQNAMDKYKVEIAGGLGPSIGKVWRVGILGYNAQPQNIQLVLNVFRDGLKQQGGTGRGFEYMCTTPAAALVAVTSQTVTICRYTQN